MTTITRCRPWRSACRRAKDMAASVLPPPVGTVSEKRPAGRSAAARQASSTTLRWELTGESPLAAASRTLASTKESSRFRSSPISAKPPRSGFPISHSSASSRSASTRLEWSIRIQNSRLRRHFCCAMRSEPSAGRSLAGSVRFGASRREPGACAQASRSNSRAFFNLRRTVSKSCRPVW